MVVWTAAPVAFSRKEAQMRAAAVIHGAGRPAGLSFRRDRTNLDRAVQGGAYFVSIFPRSLVGLLDHLLEPVAPVYVVTVLQ